MGVDEAPGDSGSRVMRIAGVLRRIDAWIARGESALLVALLGLLVVAGFWQVVQRNLGTAAASWVDTFNRHLVLWIGLLGAMLATREGKHVNIEAVRKFLPAAIERWVDSVVHLFAAGVSAFFAWVAWLYLEGEIAAPSVLFRVEVLGWAVRTWWTETILPIAFLMIALRFLARSIASVVGVPKPPSTDTEGTVAIP